MYGSQASDLAYQYIVEKIRSGEWRPCDKIATEDQLCRELQISKSAVRSAIEKLVALSILKKIQGSGTYVQKVEDMSIMSAPVLGRNHKQTMDILEFRRMFDAYNVTLFMKRCTEEEIEALVENYRNMIRAKNDMAAFQKYDQEFHDIIARGTKNSLIIQISNLFTEIFQSNQANMYLDVGPEDGIRYHAKILANIREGHAELASIYARMSIENAMRATEEQWGDGQQRDARETPE